MAHTNDELECELVRRSQERKAYLKSLADPNTDMLADNEPVDAIPCWSSQPRSAVSIVCKYCVASIVEPVNRKLGVHALRFICEERLARLECWRCALSKAVNTGSPQSAGSVDISVNPAFRITASAVLPVSVTVTPMPPEEKLCDEEDSLLDLEVSRLSFFSVRQSKCKGRTHEATRICYNYARLCSILRRAKTLGMWMDEKVRFSDFDQSDDIDLLSGINSDIVRCVSSRSGTITEQRVEQGGATLVKNSLEVVCFLRVYQLLASILAKRFARYYNRIKVLPNSYLANQDVVKRRLGLLQSLKVLCLGLFNILTIDEPLEEL